MDVFPKDYADHNLPLLLLSGLETEAADTSSAGSASTVLREGGFRLKTDLPVLKSPLAAALLRSFFQHDAGDVPWRAGAHEGSQSVGALNIRSIGRVGQAHSCHCKYLAKLIRV